MTGSEFNEATENLIDWTARDEWAPLLMQVHMDYLDSLGSILDGDEYELLEALGDAAEMMFVFIVEDFFTARFGERGELNVIDDYLEKRGWCESVRGRRYLEGLRDSRPSLYEVVGINPGRSMTVRDLIVDGESVTVQEQQGSRMATLWDRLATRIVAVNGERVFSAGALRFRHEASNSVLEAFDKLVKEARWPSGRKSRRARGRRRKRRRRSSAVSPMARRAILRSLPCAEILMRFWLADVVSQAQAPLPELRNTDDETMVICEVRFPIIGDESRISAVLDGIETFDRDEDGEAQWIWWAPGTPSHRLARLRRGDPAAESENVFGNTTLGHVEIGAGVLTLTVNSMERADRGQALLASRLGDLVGRALVSSQDPYQAMEKQSSGSVPDDSGPPPEEAVQAIHSYLDEHYRQTLDEPLPVLGGRTLRRAARTKKGRREVIDWLKQLENLEYRRAAGQGLRVYDTRWIWKELGIERPG